MDRQQALLELTGRVSDKNRIKHSIAVEAIMKTLAAFFDEDIDIWGLTGLLHDIDYEKTLYAPQNRGKVAAEILENLDMDGTIVYAVKAHNDIPGFERRRKIDKALYAADPGSELIFECISNTQPDNISDLSVKTIIDSFNNKLFAAQIDRSKILECEKLGLSLEKFIELSLDSIRSIKE